jgi:acyl-CoA reductase-like NAD-dependent aldehyde dehydrogenase
MHSDGNCNFGGARPRSDEKAAWYARPAEEVAADLARLEDLLFNRAPWKFASTVSDNPHSYTLRRRWDWPGGDEDFQWAVRTIRTIADREKFPPSGPHARWYTVLHLRGAKFWPMNYPINYPSGKPCTILIDRKPPHLPGDRR